MASFIKEIFSLTVPEYIPVGIFNLMAGLAFSAHKIPLSLSFGLAIICTIFVIAGYNSYNAIFDLEMDKINKPNRPLPMNTLTIRDAYYASLFFFAIALVAAYFISSIFLIITAISIIFAVLYSFPGIHLKKVVVLGTVIPTLLYSVLFPLLGWAIENTNPVPIFFIIYISLFGIATAAIKDFEDIEGDGREGAHTPVIKLGYSKTLYLVSCLFFASAILLISLAFSHLIPYKYAWVALLTIPALINVHSLYKNKNAKYAGKAFILSLIIMMLVDLTVVILSLTF